MRNFRRRTALVLSLILALALLCGCAANPEEVQAQFDAFLEQEFIDSIESDYLAMHIYLMHPEEYGIDREKISVDLGSRNTLEARAEMRQGIDESLKKLKSFRRAQLTPEQQDTYDIYLFYLEGQKKLSQEKFDYFDQSFSDTGMYTQLPTLFADYRFYTEQDIADMIVLLEDTRDYLNSDIDFAKLQQEKGTLSVDCDAVIEYCNGLLEEGEQSSVLESIRKNIKAMNLDASAEQEYLRQLEEVFFSSFLPAYQDIADAMEELKAQGAAPKAIADMKGGREYYEALLQYKVGTKASAKEFFKQINGALEAEEENVYAVLNKEGVLQRYMEIGLELSTEYTDFSKMLKDLEQMIKGHFPDVGDVDYIVEPIAPALAVDTLAAYFYIPSLDGGERELIKVNTTSTTTPVSALETFMTIAHEGFPGHLYQHAYMRKNPLKHSLRQLISIEGYTEGYAKYIESLAAHYPELDEDLAELYCINATFSGYLVVLADIGIHYEGWNKEQLHDFLVEYGLNEEVFDEVYQQLLVNPGIYLSYFGGRMEFVKLRQKAEDALGERFDEVAFHEVILKYGSVPFDFLNEKLEQYLQEQGQRAAA